MLFGELWKKATRTDENIRESSFIVYPSMSTMW